MDLSHREPNPLLDPFIPAATSWVIVTSARLGLFDCLGKGCLDPTEIAEHLGSEAGGVEQILNVLEHLGWVERRASGFVLTDVARETAVAGDRPGLANWLRFSRYQLLALERLEESVRSGGRVDLLEFMETQSDLLCYQLAMADTARPIADWLANRISLQLGASRMLDIGGSHGVYASALRRRHGLEVDVLELGQIVEIAEQVAVQLGTRDGLNYLVGDIRTADLTQEYDLILMSNLVHHLDPTDLRAVLNKAFRHLRSGGTLAIWDFAEHEDSGDLVSASFSLLFHLTSGARCYSESELRRELEAAGFAQRSTHRPGAPTGHTLATAVKPL